MGPKRNDLQDCSVSAVVSSSFMIHLKSVVWILQDVRPKWAALVDWCTAVGGNEYLNRALENKHVFLKSI